MIWAVAVDCLVNARYSNTIADLDKVGISRIEGIYAPANVRSHFLCAVRKEHCTASGGHSATGNGDLTACATRHTGLIPASDTSAAIATCCGHVAAFDGDLAAITRSATADASATRGTTGCYYCTIVRVVDSYFAAITLITATNARRIVAARGLYFATVDNDGATSATSTTTDACAVIICSGGIHCTPVDGYFTTIAVLTAADACTIARKF